MSTAAASDKVWLLTFAPARNVLSLRAVSPVGFGLGSTEPTERGEQRKQRRSY
jgi:hypothetical protein